VTDTADETADPAVVARLVAIADTASDDGAWLAALLADPLARTATAADLLTAARLLRRRDLTMTRRLPTQLRPVGTGRIRSGRFSRE
jgi:hypothetical protein